MKIFKNLSAIIVCVVILLSVSSVVYAEEIELNFECELPSGIDELTSFSLESVQSVSPLFVGTCPYCSAEMSYHKAYLVVNGYIGTATFACTHGYASVKDEYLVFGSLLQEYCDACGFSKQTATIDYMVFVFCQNDLVDLRTIDTVPVCF